MSYSFLTDVYPSWKDEKHMDLATTLHENFNDIKPSRKEVRADRDLKNEAPLDTNRGPGPQPFDSTSEYMKIISGDWNKDMDKYQAQAREPHIEGFASANGPEYLEEDQLSNSHIGDGCMNVAKHIDECKECRTRLEVIFRKYLVGSVNPEESKKTVEKRTMLNDMTDMILLVCIGLFIIFILDGFVRLGKYLRR